ncbi:MAG: monovalent cation/H(+) antiporter subunit G [Pseudomonadota bacterium]
MTYLTAIIASLLLIIGAFFALLAAMGLWRFPDIYCRSHSASKAGTLGSGLMLLALAVHAGDLGTVTRAIAGVLFFLLTAPLSAHLLARAAYFAGYPMTDESVSDEIGLSKSD